MKQTGVFCLLFLLFACGPKEIGSTGWTDDAPGEISAADGMRYPVMGANRTQQLLYHYNRPDVMQSYQHWQLDRYRRMLGAPSPEDPAYRATPRERSPFRQ